MTSKLDVRLGAQVPVISHLPPDVHNLDAAEEAIELADAYGVCDGHPLSESQKITIRAAGGERADGSWAATRIGDFGPRQGTGKNDKIAAWELAHLLLFGTKLIIHTAHEFPTANESFLRLVAVFDAWDDLGKKVERIRYANGEQGIELKPQPTVTYQTGGTISGTGQRLKYRARTGGSGRGFAKAGLLIYDEAQHLHREHVAASGPAKLANPNSQTWYAGSGGLTASAVAWAMRRAAILGTGGRLAYTEMTGETVTVVRGEIVTEPPDPLDRDVWYSTIPGLGRWVTEEGVESQYDDLGPEMFTREILCVWDPEPSADGETWVLPKDRWEHATRTDSKIVSDQATLAVAVSRDRDRAVLVAAGESNLGGVHAGVLRYDPNTAWLADEIKKYGTRVVVAKDSPATAVIADLERAGITVEQFSSQEQGAAFGQVKDLLTEGEFWHHGQGELDLSVKLAELRETEGGVLLLSARRSSVDISPLVAVTLAASKYLQPTEPERKSWVMIVGGD